MVLAKHSKLNEFDSMESNAHLLGTFNSPRDKDQNDNEMILITTRIHVYTLITSK